MSPDDLSYSSDHEWVHVEGDVATVGITDFAQEQLGDIVYVSLPQDGDTIAPGSSIGELESTKSVSDLFAPVAGVVLTRNAALEQAPEVVNSDPYGEGWLIKVRLDEDSDLSDLMDAASYERLIAT